MVLILSSRKSRRNKNQFEGDDLHFIDMGISLQYRSP
jgi:hypothetical protein